MAFSLHAAQQPPSASLGLRSNIVWPVVLAKNGYPEFLSPIQFTKGSAILTVEREDILKSEIRKQKRENMHTASGMLKCVEIGVHANEGVLERFASRREFRR